MKPTESEEARSEAAPTAVGRPYGPFGPLFFLRHLTAFVRERCPDPAESLPVVLLHLMDGEVLDVCHVIGLAPEFVALAVIDAERDRESRVMRTELLPYEMIHRITVRSMRPAEMHVGFHLDRVPRVIEGTAASETSPEETLRAAATVTVARDRGQ